jgi:hypothetical protein
MFHRFITDCNDAHAQRKAAAHRLLDSTKAGANTPACEVSQALRITGDLDGDEPCNARCPHDDCAGCARPHAFAHGVTA